MQKWSKVTGKHGRHTDGHTCAFGKALNCSLMTTVGKRLKKALTFNLPYFVYCPECFFPQLFSFQNANKCEHDYVEEFMQLSPGRRMGRTVWPKGQTLIHHSSATSYAGAASFLVSTGLVQQVISVSTGTYTGRLTSGLLFLGRLWKDEIWNLYPEEGTTLWSLTAQLTHEKCISSISCRQPYSVCWLFWISNKNA